MWDVPLDITFPSAHHSPKTVNKNAREFVIGTVRLNSTPKAVSRALTHHHHHHHHHHPFHFPNPELFPNPPPTPICTQLPTPPYKREEEKNHHHHLPALPISKKNHTLPVKFTTSGSAYAGLRSRSATVHAAFRTRRWARPARVPVSRRSREGWAGGWKWRAARRMKGVVRPQARPTRRKPRVQLRMEGGEGGGASVSDIVGVGWRGGRWDGEWGFVVRGSLEVWCMTKRNPPVFEPMRYGLDMGSDNSIGVTPLMCLYRCILAQK